MAKAKSELMMTLVREGYLGALQRHRERLEELKAMGPKLRMLEAYRPAIVAAGIVLRVNKFKLLGGDHLWIDLGGPPVRNATLLRVLLEQGMREKGRIENIDCSLVTLCHGHLTLTVPVDAGAEQKAVQA